MSASTPLAGMRVLDLSRALAGPLVGRIFESLGADVVKIEPPDGDITRDLGAMRHGLSGYYIQQNVGKRNVCIDLQTPDGAALFLRLAAEADVVIENYRPGVLDRLGIGWEVLHAANPRLVLLSISGYGQHGLESDRPAYAPVIHAESGLLARQAQAEGTRPHDLMLSVADVYGALHGMIGTMAALLMRATSGRGQHIDVALFDAMLFTDDYAHFALDSHPIDLTSGEVWDVVDGQIMIAGDFRGLWSYLSRAGLVKDLGDPNAQLEAKIARRRALTAEFLASFEDRGQLGDRLERAGVVWGEIRSQEEAFASPNVEARQITRLVDDRGGGQRRVVQPPYRFSDAEYAAGVIAAYRGEHNASVLREWLRLTDAEISSLEARGVLVAEEQDPSAT